MKELNINEVRRLAKRMIRHCTLVPESLVECRVSNEGMLETYSECYVDVNGSLHRAIIQIDRQTIDFLGSKFIPALCAHEIGHVEAKFYRRNFHPLKEEIYADLRAMEILYDIGFSPMLILEELKLYSREFGYDFIGDGLHPTGRQRIAECQRHLREQPWLLL